MGFMYILLCEKDRLYVGSTIDLEKRLTQHFKGEGANFTKKFKPIKLIYFEEFFSIFRAFQREKQVQRWSRTKKNALIEGNSNLLISSSKKIF
jgi:putative endonuclease